MWQIYSKEKMEKRLPLSKENKQPLFYGFCLAFYFLSHPSFLHCLSSTHQCFAFFIHNLLFLFVCYPFMSTCEFFCCVRPFSPANKIKIQTRVKSGDLSLSLALPRLCALSYLNVKTLSSHIFLSQVPPIKR